MRLVYLRDERERYNVIWVYEHPMLGEIGVVNPRMEPDGGDDGSLSYYPTWDRILVNGKEATDDQKDEITDDLVETLRREDWS
jgi:hypothetical protein